MTQQEKANAILTVVASIPYGKVSTYGEIARMASLPGHARLVGSVMKGLPKGSTLPWFRVINSHGRISFLESSDKYRLQKQLLEREGVMFKNEKVNLKQFKWVI